MVNLLLLLLAVVLVCGCDQNGIKVYSVPKEQPASTTQAEPPPTNRGFPAVEMENTCQLEGAASR